jgi:hypothetical protein
MTPQLQTHTPSPTSATFLTVTMIPTMTKTHIHDLYMWKGHPKTNIFNSVPHSPPRVSTNSLCVSSNTVTVLCLLQHYILMIQLTDYPPHQNSKKSPSPEVLKIRGNIWKYLWDGNKQMYLWHHFTNFQSYFMCSALCKVLTSSS